MPAGTYSLSHGYVPHLQDVNNILFDVWSTLTPQLENVGLSQLSVTANKNEDISSTANA